MTIAFYEHPLSSYVQKAPALSHSITLPHTKRLSIQINRVFAGFSASQRFSLSNGGKQRT